MSTNTGAEPIHVSIGLLLKREQNSGKSKGKPHTWVAHNMQLDHVAILLDEPGAATPDDGVGIFVNADNTTQEVEVENVDLTSASNCTQQGLLNKTKFFFTNASNYSFDDISRAIGDKLREGRSDDDWVTLTVNFATSTDPKAMCAAAIALRDVLKLQNLQYG